MNPSKNDPKGIVRIINEPAEEGLISDAGEKRWRNLRLWARHGHKP